MVFQAISPSFWGYWADIYGRRPILLLSLLLYNLSNVGLALTYDYPMLLCFRILQAFATSSTIGVGTGVIGKSRRCLLVWFSQVLTFSSHC